MRAALATRGLEALDEAVREAADRHDRLPPGVEEGLRLRLMAELHEGDNAAEDAQTVTDGHRLELAVLRAQQSELLRLREAGTPDAVVRPAMHDLDLQLSALQGRRREHRPPDSVAPTE